MQVGTHALCLVLIYYPYHPLYYPQYPCSLYPPFYPSVHLLEVPEAEKEEGGVRGGKGGGGGEVEVFDTLARGEKEGRGEGGGGRTVV